MALTTFAAGDIFHRAWAMRAKVPKSGYTAVVGDCVVLDDSVANGVDLCAAGETAFGMVDSINSGNGTLSVIAFVTGTSVVLPISGTVNKGDSVDFTGSTSATGTSGPVRSICRQDNVDGTGHCIATGTESPAGTGTAVIYFP